MRRSFRSMARNHCCAWIAAAMLLAVVRSSAAETAENSRPRGRTLNASSPSSAICLNLGSDFEAAGSLVSFSPQAYLGIGSVFEVSTLRPITNLEPGYPESLYKTMVQNDAPFTYQIPMSVTSAVKLRFHFAEITNFKVGARIFNVLVEGVVQIANLDVADVSGNFRAHVIETGQVTIQDGIVDVEFVPIVDYAMISGIEVIPLLIPDPMRLNIGSNDTVSTLGVNGLSFEGSAAVQYLSAVGDTFSGTLDAQSITLTDASYPLELYTTLLEGSDFTYTIPVDSAEVILVDIKLHFCDHESDRMPFSVEVNGDLVIPSLDARADGFGHTLVKLVRVFVQEQQVRIRLFANFPEGHAVLNGLEVIPVDQSNPIRVNLGSYATIGGGDDGLLFGSQADFLFDEHGEVYPEYGLGGVTFSPPEFHIMSERIAASVANASNTPSDLYESLAFGPGFRISIPLPPSWSVVNLRVHLRRASDDLNDLDYYTRTSAHVLSNIPFSTRQGIRQLIAHKHLVDSIEVWEGKVQVTTGSMLYLFFTSNLPSWPFHYQHGESYLKEPIAHVSGIEIIPLESEVVSTTQIMKPIRLYEGENPYKDWIPGSVYRPSFLEQSAAGGAITFKNFEEPTVSTDPYYDKSLYGNCLIMKSVVRDSSKDFIHYTIPIPSEVAEIELRFHFPQMDESYDSNFAVTVNNGWNTWVNTLGSSALIVTNLKTIFPDGTTGISPIASKSDDGYLHIELAAWAWEDMVLCGIEVLPFTSTLTRVSPGPSYVSAAYGPTDFFPATFSLETPYLARLWRDWNDFKSRRDSGVLPQENWCNREPFQPETVTDWESFGCISNQQSSLIQYYPGTDVSTIGQPWAGLYPEAMMETFFSSMEFDTEFSFRLPAPSGAEFVRVRLFFVEMFPQYAGKRKFHVDINGVRVLSDYSMQIEGWSAYSLIIEEIPVAVDNRDDIVITVETPPPDEDLFAEQLNGATFDDVFQTETDWIAAFGDSVAGPLGYVDPLFDGPQPNYAFGVHKPTGQINGIEILPLAQNKQSNDIRVNCGGRGWARDFLMDAFYSGVGLGVDDDRTPGATGTMNTLRYGTTIRYAIPVVPDVTIVFVRLGFIEFSHMHVVGRTCNITIEGKTERVAFDVFAEAGGTDKETYFHEFVPVGSENRLIDIELVSTDGTTACIISTIEVIPWDPLISDVILMDAGADASPLGGPSYPFQPAFGATANDFVNATGQLSTSAIRSVYQPRLGIQNVPLDVPQRVFKSMVYGQDFSYRFEIPSDHARIILHMADICHDEENVESLVFDTSCGIREMTVLIQDEEVLTGFQPAPLTAYTKFFDLKIPARVAHVRFVSSDPTSQNEFTHAFVNAIEVINLKPFTLNAGSALYSNSLAYGHYLLNEQEPRRWASKKNILNVQEGYPMSLYQTLYGSKDVTFLFPCQPEAVLIRFHFCDITEQSAMLVRKQRIYVDNRVVLEDFDPTAAAMEDYGEAANKAALNGVPIAYYWDKLHFRHRSSRKVRVRIDSQVPGVQAILSGIQLIPLFDHKVTHFGIGNHMKNLGTQHLVGMTGEPIIAGFHQTYDVPVTGTHGVLLIKFKEIYGQAGVTDCDDVEARLNTINVGGTDVLADFDVCQAAGGYGKTYTWQGSAPAGENGYIRVSARSNRPYEFPIVDEVEAFSHYILDEMDQATNSAMFAEDDGDEAATS